jgi:anti-sigma regulatory factor (Ser/Thr protein kinase)
MPASQSTRNVSLTFDIDDHAPALVRNFVADLLTDHPRRPDILVAVSELVTNVVRHAPGTDQAALSVITGRGDVRIGIKQRGKPFSRAPLVATAPGGRGLIIVESLADDWGVDMEGEMLEVWFRMSGG